MMKQKTLKTLLLGLSPSNIYGKVDVDVAHVADDSRKVKGGGMFVAWKGIKSDGHDYIENAIEKGVKVIVAEKINKKRTMEGVTYVVVKDSKKALGKIASNWYGNPSKKLKVIGITGTKGKTTVSHLVFHILSELGKKVGLVSTIAAKIGKKEMDTGFHVTSPDALTLNSFLKDMVDGGAEFAVLEVSSHGIAQGRISGVNFDVSGLTNIAPEHLDFHKSFKEYKKIKLDFLKSTKRNVRSRKDTKIDVLPGKFNNINAQLAIDLVGLLGIKESEALKTLKNFELPTGRLEEIKNKKGIKIIVDFAHTPDSLKETLEYLRTQTKGNLISVFGAAGERDTKKRFAMGKVSGALSDISILTAEDPRGEDVYKILALMAKGCRSAGAKEIKPGDGKIDKGSYFKVPERSEAIIFGIQMAKKGDLVAVFGKAHERSMAWSDVEHPWSDHKMINYALDLKADMAAIILAAGKGTRMKANSQKVLRKISGRPIASYILLALRKCSFENVVFVVKHKKKDVIKRFLGHVSFVDQEKTLGTGHAVQKGMTKIPKNIKTVVVVNGDDSAFYTPDTIKDVLREHKENGRVITFVSLVREDVEGLGRVIRDKKGKLSGIVEEKEASGKEKKIKEVNDGLYVFDRKWLEKGLKKIKKSKVGEYYLVDLIKIAIQEGKKVDTYRLHDNTEWQGVNSSEQLEKAKSMMVKKIEADIQNGTF